MNINDQEYEAPEDLEEISEGWWDSVMEEDRCYSQAMERKRLPILPVRDEKIIRIDEKIEQTDWDTIIKLFNQEAVVSGTVVDFNKGGLLVCGDNFPSTR